MTVSDPCASGFVNFPRRRPLSGCGTWIVVSPPLLHRAGLQPAHSCARLFVRHGAWSPLLFSYCLVFFQLRCADSQGFFSICALPTAHLTCTDQAGLPPPPPLPCQVRLHLRCPAVFAR